MRNPYSLLRIIILLILTVIGAEAQNCCANLTQAQVDAIMNSINVIQTEEVPGGECFSHPCYPQNGLAGDIIITDSPGAQAFGNRGTLTDFNGNQWSLIARSPCDGSPGDWWWGGIALNGNVIFCGYSIAIRLLNDGEVYVEEAKQGGWWSLTANGGSPTGTYVQDPGPGPNNVGGGGPPPTESLSVNAISDQAVNTTFTVSGSISNASSTPTLQYENIVNGVASGTWLALPAGNSVSTTSFSFTHPAVGTSEGLAIAVRDKNSTSVTATSNAFNVGTPPGQATINIVTVPNTATLTLANGTVLSIDAAGNIYANNVLVPGGNNSKAVGANVVPDNIIWGEDFGSGVWFTVPSSGGTFTQANPQPITHTLPPAAPTLQYQDIINGVAGPWLSLPAGSSVTTTSYSFTHPAVATPAASFAVAVRDANNTAVFVTSNAFAVTGPSGSDAGLMCSDVGAAVNTANPGLLIICEGPINNSATLFSGAANQTAFVGDLSAVATLPVTGIAAGKLVYSVHDYPTNVSGQTPDATSPTTATRNVAWGYLETNNTAPVWIGAMGASLDGTNGSLSDDQSWSALLVSYLNGGQSAAGGPVFTGIVLPMSTNWWSWGNRASENPNGTLNADTSLKAGQKAVWSQLLFKVPIVPPVVTTWDPANKSNMVLSGNNLIATASASGVSAVRSTTSKSAGKLCWQEVLTTVTPNLSVGFADSSWLLTSPVGSAFSFDAVPGYMQGLFSNNVQLSIGTASTVTNGEAVTMCADFGAQLFWFTDATMRLTDPWNNDILANQNPATGAGGIPFSSIAGPWFIQASVANQASVITLNPTGPFAVATPSGFSPWDTAAALGTRPSLLINLGANDNLPPAANDNVKVRLVSTMELGQ